MIGKTISHYKILEKIGEGGMGVVYKAEDTKLKRTVALKFLPPELTRDVEAKDRFIQEARAAATLDHPNICNVFEIDETEDSQLFIAMACYEGKTLKERIKPEGAVNSVPLPIKEAVDIAIQMARGLERAHRKEIVHRDIKPANIFVTHDHEVKILDFGLAKLKGQSQLTKDGHTLGTVAYMSPEQAEGREVDRRSDIWSMGIVLYEMLTGQLPFEGEYEQAVIYSVLNEDPVPIRSLRGEVPEKLSNIVRQMLAKSPGERILNMEDVINFLKEFATGEGYLQSTSSTVIIKRPVSKNTWLLTAVFIAVFALMAAYFFLFKPAEPVPEMKEKMLVVLPFENLGAPEDNYFADGITEEITSRLAPVHGLGVISRTSAMQYKNTQKTIKQIGEELAVDYVLEGTVRWSKGGEGKARVRVTPQLIKVADDTHLWSKRYDRVIEDIFAVQSEIAEKVIKQLDIKL
ncbi:MAG: protein kinase, partial [Deltaproteobacteria bacterium]|nr:protein kinase [Deltaproteobacteria bacterium]